MSEQKITTDEIREAIYGHLPPSVRAEEEPKFDRWLASVKADAWDLGDNARRVFVESDDYSTWPMDYRGQPRNPYLGGVDDD
jgi:hypothetical protein